MPWTATTTAINTFTVGLFGVCATIILTGGTSAPPCIAAFTSGLLGVIVGIASDAYDGTHKTADKHPPGIRSLSDVPSISDIFVHSGDHTASGFPLNYAMLDNMEHFHPYNITNLAYDIPATLERRGEDKIRIRVKMSDAATPEAEAMLLFTRAPKCKYEELFADARYNSHDGGVFPSKADIKKMGQQIANKVVKPGVYCTTIHGLKDKHYISMGLTASGSCYHPTDQEPPCDG